ncbi:hypothetical protein WMY93_013567 [Mugilogobius chulae]|uniref:Uncharacterized protein n=1 Tax=Mugilogobius chulae TaxID=88201 RepID=A0AAW0P0C3_9GOBI
MTRHVVLGNKWHSRASRGQVTSQPQKEGETSLLNQKKLTWSTTSTKSTPPGRLVKLPQCGLQLCAEVVWYATERTQTACHGSIH